MEHTEIMPEKKNCLLELLFMLEISSLPSRTNAARGLFQIPRRSKRAAGFPTTSCRLRTTETRLWKENIALNVFQVSRAQDSLSFLLTMQTSCSNRKPTSPMESSVLSFSTKHLTGTKYSSGSSPSEGELGRVPRKLTVRHLLIKIRPL